MSNLELTPEQRKGWEKLYEKDLQIIGEFIKQKRGESYRLIFKDGTQLIAYYIGGCDSDNGLDLDDPDYEEFYELEFKIRKIEKKGLKLDYKKDEWISLNYHNFFDKFELCD